MLICAVQSAMAGTLSADRSRVVGREADFVSPQTTISKGSGVLLEDDPGRPGGRRRRVASRLPWDAHEPALKLVTRMRAIDPLRLDVVVALLAGAALVVEALESEYAAGHRTTAVVAGLLMVVPALALRRRAPSSRARR